MPITNCTRIEWKDIFLNDAVISNQEDIPIIIEIKSLNNPSLVNSVVTFEYTTNLLTQIKSTSDGSLVKTFESSDKVILTTKLTPEDDLWDIPLDSDLFRIPYKINVLTTDGCRTNAGAGKFFIERIN